MISKSLRLLAIISLLATLSITCSNGISQKQVAELHNQVLTVDTHADTPMRLMRGTFNLGEYHDPAERGSGKVDFPRMKEGGLDAQFFAIFVGQGKRDDEGHARAKSYADRTIEAVKKACKDNAELAEIALTPDDGYRIEKAGKRAIYMGMENGYPIGKDITLVDKYYNDGVRYITLCHGGNNEICDSATDREGPEWDGLSPFGENVVARMNELGMIIDVSHLSDSSFYDVARLSKAPFMASHSCCRVLCDHPRNLTDDMLKVLAERDGVIQMCFVSSFLITPEENPRRNAALDSLRKARGDYYQIKDEKVKEAYREAYYEILETYPVKEASIEDLVDHIDHVVELIGIDHVGIGTDYDGGGGFPGANDVSELSNVTAGLMRRGYSKEDIEKIWGGNFMRVFRDVVKVSESLKQG
jgi:membrane dipeptidase